MLIVRHVIIALACIAVLVSAAQGQVDTAVTLTSDSSSVMSGQDINVELIIAGGYDLAATYIELDADTAYLHGATASNSQFPDGYVFGQAQNNFISLTNTTANGYRWTLSDLFDPENDGTLSSRLDAVDGGDILGSFTLHTSPDFTGEVTFSVNLQTLELLDINAEAIAGFDTLVADLQNSQPLTIAVVPEPASISMLLTGCLTLIRKRK